MEDIYDEIETKPESEELLPGDPDATLIRALVDLTDRTLQKARIAFGNRLLAVEQGRDRMDPDQQRILRYYADRLQEMEDEATAEIGRQVDHIEIVKLMRGIRGIGPKLGAKVYSAIDIQRSSTVSKLWRYSGYGMGQYWCDAEGGVMAPVRGSQWITPRPDEGEDPALPRKKKKIEVVVEPEPEWHLETLRDRPLPSWALPYNQRLKTALHLVGESFLKSGSAYRLVYDQAKETYARERDWKPGHRNMAAMRKMLKVFLSHLWQVWRTLEGLPVRPLYVEEHEKGHSRIYQPEEFGWPSLAEIRSGAFRERFEGKEPKKRGRKPKNESGAAAEA